MDLVIAYFDHIHWLSFTIIAFAVLIGAFVQGLSGLGLGLVAAPVLIALDPEMGPAPLLACAILLSGSMMVREFGSIDRQGLAYSLVGRVFGSIAAGAVYARLSVTVYELLFGLLIIGAVILSVAGLRVRRTPRNLVSAGFTSGIMGTLTSAGSPTIALIYQRSDGATVRATLSAFFLASSIISLTVLIAIGKFGTKQLVASVVFLPTMLIGFALSSLLVKRLSNEWVRWFVLGLSGSSSLFLVGKAMVKLW